MPRFCGMTALCELGGSLQRLFHRAHALVDHRADRRCGVVRQQVGNPDRFGAVAIGEDLHRRIVMRHPLALRRPAQPPRRVVLIDDDLLHHEPVTERDDARIAALHAAVGDEARDEALVDVADVAYGVPDLLWTRIDADFPADRSHEPSYLKQTASTLLPSGSITNAP